MASVWAVIEDRQHILLVQRSERTRRPGQWRRPGGGIHAGEGAEAACAREVAEEVGLCARCWICWQAAQISISSTVRWRRARCVSKSMSVRPMPG
ncbi:NUDIX domain-containing protein [Uliginosibacterium gangwonense]|uniref:NUDIX domain-containing protein n=1 Tax=Uliginosibacterium gangwonense TaxID=392736 RepID=UPI000A00FD63